MAGQQPPPGGRAAPCQRALSHQLTRATRLPLAVALTASGADRNCWVVAKGKLGGKRKKEKKK